MRTPKPILERRRSVRVHESLPFTIGHDGYETLAQTVNVSLHGALCLVDRNIPLMTQLAVALTLSAAKSVKRSAGRTKTIHMKGVVVRREKDPGSNRYFLAIYFSQIKSEDQEALRRFIENRLSSNPLNP